MLRRFVMPLVTLAISLLVACAPVHTAVNKSGLGSSYPPGVSSVVPTASVTPTSTLPTPAPPRFLAEQSFVADAKGRGEAMATFVGHWSSNPGHKGWSRIAHFAVDDTKVDGVWVYNMTFWGRLTTDTVITTQEQTAFGSDEFPTITRRVADILRANPGWGGPMANARVAVTFQITGDGPVHILTLRQLDPIWKTARLPGAGPTYSRGGQADPLVRSALAKTGAVRGAIVGYVVDFKYRKANELSILELVVAKNGSLFHMVGGLGGLVGPGGPFVGKPPLRAQPESAAERTARDAALARAAQVVHSSEPLYGASQPLVYGYVVRITRQGGTSLDGLVQNNGLSGNWQTSVMLQPWTPHR